MMPFHGLCMSCDDHLDKISDLSENICKLQSTGSLQKFPGVISDCKPKERELPLYIHLLNALPKGIHAPNY